MIQITLIIILPMIIKNNINNYNYYIKKDYRPLLSY